jgi:uncharacterized protein (DUF2225 family)
MLSKMDPVLFSRRRLVRLVGSLATFASTGMARPLLAFTHDQRTIDCPVDGTKFQVYVTMSYTTFGAYRDFQKRGAVGSLYEELIVSCPSCGFAGWADDFAKPLTPRTLVWVLGEFHMKWGGRKLTQAEECEAAADRYIFEQEKNETIGFLYLVASYLLRGAKGPLDDKRKEYQRLAARFHMQALDAGEVEADRVGSVIYLVAELERRTGDFRNALDHYDAALKLHASPDWLKDLAKGQRAQAVNRNADNDL